MDMREDIFAEYPFGKIALKKINPKSPNFRLYAAGWVETAGHTVITDEMSVSGAEFSEEKTGPNKGELSVRVPDTTRTVRVTASEIRAFEAAQTAASAALIAPNTIAKKSKNHSV
jgi:hypothetical protein